MADHIDKQTEFLDPQHAELGCAQLRVEIDEQRDKLALIIARAQEPMSEDNRSYLAKRAWGERQRLFEMETRLAKLARPMAPKKKRRAMKDDTTVAAEFQASLAYLNYLLHVSRHPDISFEEWLRTADHDKGSFTEEQKAGLRLEHRKYLPAV